MASIKRILGVASGGQTSRVSGAPSGGSTSRVTGAASGGQTSRVSGAASGGKTERVEFRQYLLLEGGGKILLEGDAQMTGTDAILLEGDAARDYGQHTVRVAL